MPYAGLLLMVSTHLHRYAVRRDHIRELRMVASETGSLAKPPSHSEHRGPDEHRDPESSHPEELSSQVVMCCELAPLLDPNDASMSRRRHALIVASEQGGVVFLVERVEEMYHEHRVTWRPLPALIAKRLARAWFLGVVLVDETVLLVLDLRQMARDVVTNQGILGG